MTKPTGTNRPARSSALDWWRDFWFKPEPATTLGLIRIAFGVLAIAWTFSLLPDLLELLGEEGVQPEPAPIQYMWGLLHVWSSDTAVWTVWAALLIGSIVLTVGWHSRLAALVVFICILSIQRRDIYVFNSGDVLIRLEALFLMFAPCGAALSLDRRRTAGSFWSAQVRAPWIIRIMQVQVSIIYLITVHDKIVGATWNQGTAVSYALRLTDLTNFTTPLWVSTNPWLMNVATWGTLLVEFAIAILVWNRRLRPWVLGAGVVMHLMILVSLAVAFFSFAIFVLYLAFIPPETAVRLVENVRRRRFSPAQFRRSGRSRAETPADVEESVVKRPIGTPDSRVKPRHRTDSEDFAEPVPNGARRSRRQQREREPVVESGSSRNGPAHRG